jgi:2,3-bisphosphoglycerate-independent phosphoglycerate mutase
MIPSPKVATYDLQPEMSAQEVGDTIVDNVKKDFNLIVVNFANPDMVGHTGVFEAAVKAVETVDHQLQRVVDEAKENNFDILIIADHGNADQMKNPDGSAHTAHTSVPVPVILVTENDVKLSSGKLADVAPTLLKILGLNQPEEMTGKALY